ncbi:MAG: phosphatidate cytidylyltransferase [Firmicutes bacterium]|nr:phosphatidate cytidylyltransferase [Bacillota bacterium]
MFGNLRNISWQSNRTKRVAIGALILAILGTAIGFRFLTPFIFDGLVVILAWFATYEVYNAKKLDQKGVKDYFLYPYLSIAYLTFLLGILVATPFAWWLHVVMQIVLVFALCIYVFLMTYTDKEQIKASKMSKESMGKISMKVVKEYLKLIFYPAFLILLLIPINHMDRWAGVVIDGTMTAVTMLPLFAILMVFIVSMLTDTAAYAVGGILKGEKKLAPSISPKKTWVGAIAGLFGGVLGALLVILVMSIDPTLQAYLTDRIGNADMVISVVMAVGLFGSILTQAGDLYASWIKRRNDTKDFGKLLPGHGGIMDRIDGAIWNTAFIFIMTLLLVFI